MYVPLNNWISKNQTDQNTTSYLIQLFFILYSICIDAQAIETHFNAQRGSKMTHIYFEWFYMNGCFLFQLLQ